MGGSGWKIRTTHSRNAPLPSRLLRATFPGGEGWKKAPQGSFFTEPLEPIRNDFYFFGRKSVDSRAQMCYDDAIQ